MPSPRRIINHPLTCFFLISYTIPWLIWLPLYGPELGIKGLHALKFQHIIGAFGPAAAAIITTFFYERKELAGLLRSTFFTANFKLLVVSIFAPFVIGLLSISADHFLYHATLPELSFNILTRDFGKQDIVTFTLLNIATFGIGEEMGWRGFALPMLQQRYSKLTASLITTIFWAGWHLPLFLYRPGYIHMDIAGCFGWFISLLTGSILLTWFFNASKGNILICAVFHATVDVAFTYPELSKTTISMMGMLITIWGSVMGYLLYRRNRKTLVEIT